MSEVQSLRVLSLLSASTEIVCRLGCAHLLVGRSHGCDDPPLATSLPVATAPRVDPNAPSADLDAAVRAQSVSGGPIYQIRSELIRTLQPDVILTQEQCRICAVTPDDVVKACSNQPTAKMVTIMPVTLDDVFQDVTTIAAALGVHARGVRLVKMLRNRLDVVRSILHENNMNSRPTLAHVEWLEPLMGSGYWIAECVEIAGCSMVHGSKGGHSPTLPSLSQLSCAQVIVIAPCGFSIGRTRDELASLKLLESAEWKALDAVKNNRVYVADGNLYFNRSSCGVVDTAEMVAEMAWPDLKGMWGHHGKHWVSLGELDAFCDREGAPPPTKRVLLADDEMAPDVKQANLVAQPTADLKDLNFDSVAKYVEHQINLLRCGHFEEAFSMNSAANKARLGSSDKFKTVVRSNSSFAALANAANSCDCREDRFEDGKYTIDVRVQTEIESLKFAFEVSKTGDGGYATEGVRIVC